MVNNIRNLFLLTKNPLKRTSTRLKILIGLCATTFLVYVLLHHELFGAISGAAEDAEASSQQKIHGGPCTVPKLNPFHASIKKFVHPVHGIDCTANSHPLMFTTDLESNLITVRDPKHSGLENCCYTPFVRYGDRKETFSSDCFHMKGTSQKIPPEHEFIAIYCREPTSGSYFFDTLNWLFNRKTLVDMHHFIHPKPEKEKHQELREKDKDQRDLNVVILGLDSISHMNFIRTMPRTYKYLTRNLSGHGMDGYAIFEENTFANMIPLLTGFSTIELKKLCWPTKSSYFDDCPFLWKNFSAKGYRTSYAEDDTSMAIFLYEKEGFKIQPTDYYMVPLTHAMQASLTHRGNYTKKLGVCYGSRLGFSILLDNVKKMAATTGHSKRYFQFTWATSLSHEDHNYPGAGDLKLLKLLQWLNVEQYLENTIFILMSDHGARFGGLRGTEQGRIEARMPFLYFVFPKWFSQKYESAVSNVKLNRNKLTTPFDLHETLKDLLDLKSIEKDNIILRETVLKNSTEIPRGVSLFLPIPEQRKCQDAGIDLHYCACMLPLSIPTESSTVVESANSAVGLINKMLIKYSQCSQLKLDHVINAYEIYNSTKQSVSETQVHNTTFVIMITFETLPNEAIFEATLAELWDKEWILSGAISRINKYGQQSHCVNDYRVKMYCFCGK